MDAELCVDGKCEHRGSCKYRKITHIEFEAVSEVHHGDYEAEIIDSQQGSSPRGHDQSGGSSETDGESDREQLSGYGSPASSVDDIEEDDNIFAALTRDSTCILFYYLKVKRKKINTLKLIIILINLKLNPF